MYCSINAQSGLLSAVNGELEHFFRKPSIAALVIEIVLAAYGVGYGRDKHANVAVKPVVIADS